MSEARGIPQEPNRSEVSPSEAPSDSNPENLSDDMAGIEYPGKHGKLVLWREMTEQSMSSKQRQGELN